MEPPAGHYPNFGKNNQFYGLCIAFLREITKKTAKSYNIVANTQAHRTPHLDDAKFFLVYDDSKNRCDYFSSSMAACAAAKRQSFNQRFYLFPHFRENRGSVRIVTTQPMYLTAPLVIIVWLWLDERVE